MSYITLPELLEISQPKLDLVHPSLQDLVSRVITDLYNKQLYFAAYQSLRSMTEQTAIYAKGRESLDQVNALMEAAGLPDITEEENIVVTTVRVSWHNFGLAVDIVEDGDPQNVGIHWSWKDNADYLTIGTVAKSYYDDGLRWGGWWKSFQDYPHLELAMMCSLSEAYEIYKKNGDIKDVWKQVQYV